ncbi:MAG TPA: hypothetical protein EYN18_03075 [Nitrospirales bacterium]|nr:hypothetical protein [Nitrospirales bacterium]HIB55317.1 hypothetical protein [Nitrospirales bacterium]HIN33035.1 hypothetical protein [Nitrospirales bacterium]HIO21363.1 hypothetical protein [Nitrospirales bacterium]
MNIITYTLKLESGAEHHFEVDLDRTAPQPGNTEASPSEWTRLETHQCSNCPLDVSTHPYCPAALDTKVIAEKFKDIMSIERVDVVVTTNNRTYSKNCDLQTALRSLFGLVMATGGCPILGRMKPLAHFHLPFATLDETVFRLVGAYLMKQRLLHRDGTGEPDWDLKGIEDLYAQLQTLNSHFMKRIRDASREDANFNALHIFVSSSSLIGEYLDETLCEINDLVSEGL